MIDTFNEGHFRLPSKYSTGDGDVGLALGGIVLGQFVPDNFRGRTSGFEHYLGQFEHGEFDGIADVHGSAVLGPEQAVDSGDEIVDVAEAAGLGAVAVHGEWFAGEGLVHEVGDDATVVGLHAGAVRIEDTQEAKVEPVVAFVCGADRFTVTLRLVVDRARADRVDVAPVRLGLRVHGGVAVDFAGRRLEETGVVREGHFDEVLRADGPDFERLDRAGQIGRGRGGGGHIDHGLNRFAVGGVGDCLGGIGSNVVLEGSERRSVSGAKVLDVAPSSGGGVVHGEHPMTVGQEAFAQMRAKKPRPTSNNDPRSHTRPFGHCS